jgi:Ca-activated chloride channel homolog
MSAHLAMLADFHFLRPAWLAALALLPLLWYALGRDRRAGGPWEDVVAPALRTYVLERAGAGGGRARWPRWLLATGLILAVLALAGPAWRKLPQPVFRKQSALVIALDLSRSMDANDLQPSRLALARLKLLDLLQRREEGQTALIVYAAQPFVVSPLTTDAATIAALVESLATELMPAQGSRADRALALAADLLEQAGISAGDILLITDGVTDRDAQAAAVLHDHGVRVSVLGVGTAQGAPIPLAQGGLYTDPKGDIVVARLEEAPLHALAVRGGGHYSALRVDDADLDTVLPGGGETLAAHSERTQLATDLWREEGPWLLLPLACLAALAFRRGWVGMVLLLWLPLSAGAMDWDGLWKRPDQRGAAALAAGEPARAATLFADPEWKATALYRDGDYADSAQALEGLDTARAHYNRGNALARAGDFPQAIEAYQKALALDPKDADARHNLDLLRQQMRQPPQSGQNDQGSQGKSGQQDGQQQNAQQQSGQQQSGQQQSGQPGQQHDGGQQGDREPQSQQAGNARNPGAQDAPQSGGGSTSNDAAAGEQDANDEAQGARNADASQMQSEPDAGAAESDDDARREAQLAQAEQDAGGQREDKGRAAAGAELDEDEAARATEQWLRRIPDDPGGLLRRKFLYQYRQQATQEKEEAQPW